MQITRLCFLTIAVLLSNWAAASETTSSTASAEAQPAVKPQGTSRDEAAKEKPDDEESNADSDEDTLAGHSFHGEAFNEGPRQAAYLMDGTGKVSFPVASKVPQVQEYINQGVGQLHGFWYFEAERSFRQAAALDPNCAAAYWGMAMANTNNRERAKKLIKEAEDRKDEDTDRVQRYIAALSTYLEKKKSKAAAEAYIDALEKIVYDHPDDIEARAFIAVELWQGRRSGLKITSHLAVDALIQQVLDVEPMHPAHHYRIHLWDSEKADRALESAARCGQSAPAIAHMWHMPGHIYSRVKRYSDAVWQQEASARTDHAQMMRDQLLPDQIHNFAHNNEWLIRNLIFIGRFGDALNLAKNMTELPRHPKHNLITKGGSSASYGRMRLIQVLTAGELWRDAIALAATPYLEPTNRFSDQIKRLRLIGRGHFRSGDTAGGATVVADLESLLCQKFAERQQAVRLAEEKADREKKKDKAKIKMVKDARRRIDSDVRSLEKALNEMYGYMAAENQAYERAIELLTKAGEMDRRYVASLKLKIGKADEAIQLVSDYAKQHRAETIPLAHQASILWDAGKQDEAFETMRKLRQISAEIDLSATPFVRLKPITEQLKWPEDWRIALQPADDVGNRPDLDALGPFRWQPTTAANWSLESANSETISLSDYRGKPVVVIFYLGFGCLHCAEQLQAFGPHMQDFNDAGIEMIAVSTDDQTGLQKSLENYSGGDIPFPLVANPSLDVFKTYRAFDDFEDQPLHGTFLLDGQGQVRWHDISYEPFMDHQFLLGEAKRLLAQGERGPATLATANAAR